MLVGIRSFHPSSPLHKIETRQLAIIKVYVVGQGSWSVWRTFMNDPASRSVYVTAAPCLLSLLAFFLAPVHLKLLLQKLGCDDRPVLECTVLPSTTNGRQTFPKRRYKARSYSIYSHQRIYDKLNCSLTGRRSW